MVSVILRLTKEQCWTLTLLRVLIHIGDMHLVLPGLALSILDVGILIMVQQVRLNMVNYPMSFLVSVPVPLGLIGL